MTYKPSIRKALPKRTALVTALAVGLGISGLAFGQATTGALFGTAPAGDTVQIVSNTGITRTTPVGANGQWNFGHLPLGTYTVNLMKDGQTVASRSNVAIRIGAGVAVNLNPGAAQNAQNLGTVQVTANALPTIDVTTVHDSTIITAQQLRKLPVGHNAMSIALLTPGTMATSSFGSGINIGGSSIAENAYYVNGYNTGAPYRNESFFQLPYGAIGQQQTLAGGFGAKYGRSDGGVISQTGKRGTNQWHFGAQIRWEPRPLQATANDHYWPTINLPPESFCESYTPDGRFYYCKPGGGTEQIQHAPNYTPGELMSYNGQDAGWNTAYTGYVGGPLIKDKLFMFVAVEVSQSASSDITGPNGQSLKRFWRSHSTNSYAKLDWNINDSNILEFTYLADRGRSNLGAEYYYDLDTQTEGGFKDAHNNGTTDAKFEILKYTSYISDKATLSILYGHSSFKNPVIYSNASTLPYISGGRTQNPAFWGPDVNPNSGIINTQNKTAIISPDRSTTSHGLRVDFSYQLGNHKLGIGIDNMWYFGNNQGNSFSGGVPPPVVGPFPGQQPLGYAWIYGQQKDGTYTVDYYNYSNAGSMFTTQKAYYLQDNWQVTPNLLLVLGLRNDSFTNYNGNGEAFVNEKNQWSPRLGASWDVFGDSSLKIWGNIGRYYLAIPLNGANRAADNSFYLRQTFTYTGIDPDTGIPQGLDPVGPMYSPDGELGKDKDPKQVTAANLKPSYADQLNIGFDAKLGEHYQYGASIHVRRLGVAIDDVCSPDIIKDKLVSLGYDPTNYTWDSPGCRLVNPGQTSQIKMLEKSSGNYISIPVSFADWGFPMKPKRNYDSVTLYFQRIFDGKWQAKASYTYTAAFGNTTGQVRPDIGQQDVSKTEDWDSAALMVGSYGELLSARRHHFRLYGSYQVTPEWLVAANLSIMSGAPQECLGFTGPDAIGDPTGYGGGNYHSCAGRVVHPGSSDPLAGHTPWVRSLNLRLQYNPGWADHRLTASMIVYNALNEQGTLQTQPGFPYDARLESNTFHYPTARQPPRAVEFTISYDY